MAEGQPFTNLFLRSRAAEVCTGRLRLVAERGALALFQLAVWSIKIMAEPRRGGFLTEIGPYGLEP